MIIKIIIDTHFSWMTTNNLKGQLNGHFNSLSNYDIFGTTIFLVHINMSIIKLRTYIKVISFKCKLNPMYFDALYSVILFIHYMLSTLVSYLLSLILLITCCKVSPREYDTHSFLRWLWRTCAFAKLFAVISVI